MTQRDCGVRHQVKFFDSTSLMDRVKIQADQHDLLFVLSDEDE